VHYVKAYRGAEVWGYLLLISSLDGGLLPGKRTPETDRTGGCADPRAGL
jgi:hypothetical protein